MLCSACHAALITDVEGRMCWDDRNPQDFVHHPTSRDFFTAVEQKCHICLNLQYQWEHKFKLRLEFPCHLDASITHQSGEKIKSIHFSRFYLGRGSRSFTPGPWYPSGERSFFITFYLSHQYQTAAQTSEINGEVMVTFVVNPYKDVQHLLPKSGLSGNTGSDASFVLVRTWLNECQSNHTICNDWGTTVNFQPSRILDISSALTKDTLILIDTKKTPLDGPYSTLSHCWGGALHTRLLKGNLEEFKQGIKCSKLLRVYQEAIDGAIRLGVRYLWIDSLCIVQDDKDDWFKEAALMFDIYRYASFNIGATGAADGNGQCFVNHDSNLLGPCLLDTKAKVESTAVKAKPRLRDRIFKKMSKNESVTASNTSTTPINPETTWHVVEENFWTERLHRQALNTRAWVLQERMTAPRMVHFGRDQIYWECHELHACEAYTKGPQAMYELQALKAVRPHVISSVFSAKTKLTPKGSPEWMSPSLDGPQKDLALHAWSDVIKQYNKLDITVPSDKLVALSGLAKLMHGLIQDDYVAGLWKSAMTMGLLWRMNHSERRREGKIQVSRLADSAVPTWSWASMHGNVFMLAISDAKLKAAGADIHAEVKEFNLTPVANDIFGSLSSAELKIRAQFWPASFLSHDLRSELMRRYGRAEYFPFLDLGDGNWSSGGFDCVLDVPLQPEELKEVMGWFIIPVVSLRHAGSVITQGLIVRKAEGRKTGWWERCGFFMYRNEEGFFEMAEKLCKPVFNEVWLV
ncbi:heterokaryon incompatibility protein-domain-containing protein [Dendryphion nanum]|uniref:Heterokaryon incompatibility protein-domain-containing protein n=1 Tax=Dendryphion nanum TaxID=256645 RepID=A0A9P9ILF3_9PLEO|nr:heterokaryon incompatibility protein-domain-containing protein [Dendryphion nanum]